MSGWPLKPGTHLLETVVEVDEGGHTKLTMKDRAGQPMITVEGSPGEFVAAYLEAGRLLHITTLGR